MEFFIGTQFSKEFTFEEKNKLRNELEKKLNDFFSKKVYNAAINNMYISFICVSKDFESFFLVRPLKIHKKECAMEYEIKLDFESFYNSTEIERLKLIFTEFINQSLVIFENKKVKDFNSQEYINDLANCLNHSIF